MTQVSEPLRAHAISELLELVGNWLEGLVEMKTSGSESKS
jgi:hypothetical protein